MDNYCFCFTFPHSDKAVRMRVPKKHLHEHCKSAVYSISAEIIQNFPLLRPPYQYDGEWVIPNVTEEQPWEGGLFHPYYEIWVDVVLERILQHFAATHGDTIYVDIEITETKLENLKVPPSFEVVNLKMKNPENSRGKVEEAFNLPITVPSKRKMGIFVNQSYKREGEPFSMRSSKEALNVGQLYNNDFWKVFNIAEGQVPTVEELSSFNGIILSGGHGSVLELNEGQKQVMLNLMTAMKINQQLKLLGNCYGHQIIALFYGGKVVTKPVKGGLQRIEIDKDVKSKFKFLDPWPQSHLWMPQHHSLYVMDVPEGFYRLGWSNSCEVESLVSKDGRIFTVQFHFEHSYDFMKGYQKRYRYSQGSQNAYPHLYLPFDEQTENQCNRLCDLGKECMKRFFQIDQ